MSGLIESTSKNPKRKTKDKVRASCQRLLQVCVLPFSRGKSVGYSDVKNLYQDINAFYRDCRKIKEKLDELRDWFDLLGVPVPLVEYQKGRFQIPVRSFVARIPPELRDERTRLAKSLITYHQYNGEPLVPRTGTIYFGFGTTVLAAAEHLCKCADEFAEISMSTSNIEILVRCYVVAPRIFLRGHFLLAGLGEIDWNDGCLIPWEENLEISTSIISFEGMDQQGRFLADTRKKRDLVQEALKKTRGSIILVGEKSKFDKSSPSGAWPISLPVNNDCEVYLFTNELLPRKDKKKLKAAGVKPIVQEQDNLSIPLNESTRPKQPR